MNFKEWCILHNSNLLEQWDYDLNDKSPEYYLCNSQEVVNWIIYRNYNNREIPLRWQTKLYCRIQNPKIPVYLDFKIPFKDWAEANNPQLLQEWDYENNDNIENYTLNSREKVSWIYKYTIRDKEIIKRWKQSIYSKKCGNTYLGLSNLGKFENFEEWALKNNPQLLDEWDYELNKFGPNEYSSAEKEKVHWVKEVEKNGKIFKLRWEATIESRKYGSGCPQLLNQKITEGFNDFATYCKENGFYELLEQWDEENILKPTEISMLSNKKIIWHCKTCNGKWKATPNTRKSCGCPYCTNKVVLSGFNDFQTWLNNNSEMKKFIDEDENKKENIDLSIYAPHSRKLINVKCPICQYKWKTKVSEISRFRGCPVCCGKVIKLGFNDLKTVCKKNHFEYLIDEWDKGNEKSMEEYTKGSHSSVSWICSECGHKWNTSIANRMKHKGCPKCAVSKGEKRIMRYLDSKNISYTQKYTFSDCLSDNGRVLRFDFAILDEKENVKCLIEYDGEQHFKPVHFTDMDEDIMKQNLESCKLRDSIKNDYCKKNNIPLIRIPYTEFKNIETILQTELTKI